MMLGSGARGLDAQGSTANRPVIVFIHGRNQAFNVSGQMRDTWFGAFRDGVRKLRQGPIVRDEDLRFVSYEGLYEPGYEPIGCRTAEPAVLGGIGTAVDRAINWLSRAAAKTLGLRRIAYFLGDIQSYLSSKPMRCDTDRQLADTLDSLKTQGRPVVLVAHSMGSLVSYHLFASTRIGGPRFEVTRLVTVGSQLGSKDLVKALIGDIEPRFPPPAGVRRWVNIRAHYDYVAPLKVAKLYDVPPGYLSEFQIETQAGNQHGIVGYLKHPKTARAIIRGWCDAFSPGSSAPQECGKIQDVGNTDSDPRPLSATGRPRRRWLW